MLMDLRYDSHLLQLEAVSDAGSGGRRNPKISKTRKRSSTSSKRLQSDPRHHKRLPNEYQLIPSYNCHLRVLKYLIQTVHSGYSSTATAMATATAMQMTVFIIYEL